MRTFTSLDELNRFREEIIEKRRRAAERGHIQIFVGLGTCGIAAGALEALAAVKDQVQAQGLEDVSILETGCLGLCRHEPIVEVVIGESPRVTYGRVTPEVAGRIVREHVVGGKVVSEFVIESLPFPAI
jgi:NADP-reducing hydrogenase subunit HndB